MHIRPAEPGQPGSGRQNEPGTSRKLRLGGASRVPVHSQTKATDSPLRVLVSAIGQSLGSRTPLRGQCQNAGSKTPSAARSSLFSSAAKTPSATPADGRSNTSSTSSGNTNHSSAARFAAAINSSRIPSTPRSSRTQATTGTPSKIPSTPTSSRIQATAGTPSRRSSLSSSSSSASSISSNLAKKQSISSTSLANRKVAATPSKSSKKLEPTTPVTKKSFPPRTPKAQKNSTTPSSKVSCIPVPTPRRPAASSTPGPKLTTTPQTRSKSFFPTTPVSKNMSANPTTPVHGENGFSTPYSQLSSNQAFYTPTSTLPLTPLQPRNFNVPESSRRLHFGINVAAMGEQDSLGYKTPRPYSPAVIEATFSFDKNRLTQIKARRNASQLLQSPAQRIRVPDFQQQSYHTPGRALQKVAEDRSARFDESVVLNSLSQSPARRRVANSLF